MDEEIKDVYTFRAPEEIARIFDILDRHEITAEKLEVLFPELPPRCGNFNYDMTFKDTYMKVMEGLQNLQDRMLELCGLWMRDTNYNSQEDEDEESL